VYLTEGQLGQLLRPLNGRRVHKRDGMSYMEAYDIRAHLNRVFGFGRWSSDVVSMDLLFEQISEKSKNGRTWEVVTVGYRAGLRLTIRALDGETLATYTEWASGDAINFPTTKRADAHDFAMKTAESQALKRAAINLGDQFGLGLYNSGSLAPLVQRSLATPDVVAAEDGIDDKAPEVKPEDAPETGVPADAEATVDAAKSPWTAGQADARIKLTRGDRDKLRAVWEEARDAGSDSQILARIHNAAQPQEEVLEGTVQ
jgi:hypothetical protein